MRFDECREGEYRIYVGALEAPRGDGYIAAVVVKRQAEAAGKMKEAWRDDSLACGYRWPSAEAALRYALQRGREMVRTRSPMLVC